jgi:hypothetical protein
VALVFREWLDKEAPIYFVVGTTPQLDHNNQQQRLRAKTGFCTLELAKTVTSVRRNKEFYLSPGL